MTTVRHPNPELGPVAEPVDPPAVTVQPALVDLPARAGHGRAAGPGDRRRSSATRQHDSRRPAAPIEPPGASATEQPSPPRPAAPRRAVASRRRTPTTVIDQWAVAAPLTERGDAREHRLASGRPGGAHARRPPPRSPSDQQLRSSPGRRRPGTGWGGRGRCPPPPACPRSGLARASRPSARRVALRPRSRRRPARPAPARWSATPSPRIAAVDQHEVRRAGHRVVRPRLRRHHHRDPRRGELAQARRALALGAVGDDTVRTPAGSRRSPSELPEARRRSSSRWSGTPAASGRRRRAPKSQATASPSGRRPAGDRRRVERRAGGVPAPRDAGGVAGRPSCGGPSRRRISAWLRSSPATRITSTTSSTVSTDTIATITPRPRPGAARRAPPGSRPRGRRCCRRPSGSRCSSSPGPSPGARQMTSRQTTSVVPLTWVLHWP